MWKFVVPRSRWHECLLLILRGQAEELFEDYEAQAGQATHAHTKRPSGKRRCAMSTALTLPLVWATAEAKRGRRVYTTRMNDGLAFYRGRTERLLQHYLQASLAIGRAPSVVGDVTLRGRASSSRKKNFEDLVIFAIDVERCLKTLEPYLLQIVVKIVIQEYLAHEVAQQLGLDVRTVSRTYRVALDRLSVLLLDGGLIQPRNQESVSRG